MTIVELSLIDILMVRPQYQKIFRHRAIGTTSRDMGQRAEIEREKSAAGRLHLDLLQATGRRRRTFPNIKTVKLEGLTGVMTRIPEFGTVL